MNRRGFIGTLVAMPICVNFVALFTDSVGNAAKSMHRPSKVPMFLFVLPTYKEADKIHQLMGRPPNVKCIGVGGMLAGYGADFIVMDEDWRKYDGSMILKEKITDWYNCCIMTRLMPGGQMVDMKTDMAPHDFGLSTVISMEFRTSQQVLKQAGRLRIPTKSISKRDRMEMKAMLMAWYTREKSHGRS